DYYCQSYDTSIHVF
nr:immunoglobulin light chain junction region [Macaca mulatta]